MNKKKAPKDKLGLFFEKYTIEAPYSFTTHHGHLKVTRVSTNLIVGTVKEEDLKTTIMGFSPFELARLKKLLKSFDTRRLAWKADKE